MIKRTTKWIAIFMSITTLCPLYCNLYEKSIDKIKSHMGKWPHSEAIALSLIHPPPLYVK